MTKLLCLAAAIVFVGCAGHSGNDDLEVNDVGATQDALATPGPSTSDDTTGDGEQEDGAEVGDKDCRHGDKDGHAHHHRHKFSVLDALDGTVDHQITIADLPPGLPDHLIAKLHKIDTDGDGIVTKAEVKAFKKQRRHHD
jgi:hypothetical protein